MSTHKYPIKWSAVIVSRFIEKYARGYNNLKIIFSLQYNKVYTALVYTLASGNSIKWERIKAVVKTLEDYDREDLVNMSKEDRVLLYKYLGFSYDEDILDEVCAK